MKAKEPFFWVNISCGIMIMAFIVLPLMEMLTAPSFSMIKETIRDKDVLRSIWLSIYTAGLAAIIAFVFGTPLAYVLARTQFAGKRLIESIVDLPIVIPHPVVGIAILSVAGKNHWIGQILSDLGIRIMGSVTGIVIVLTFVGLPFYINAVKNGFENISPRLENVSRSLGASMFSTFFRITFPLARRSMLIGIIMCSARAISEFGAVVVVAYHPMIAPVMIYERFEAYGLRYSQPVAVWLVTVCLVLFLVLRILTLRTGKSS
ncbi:MAG: ABC transporter permease [Deltaproteobacteria bacterium]|nr:ABC transporter permease [Deltaproteobacteria bacterium]